MVQIHTDCTQDGESVRYISKVVNLIAVTRVGKGYSAFKKLPDLRLRAFRLFLISQS